ncbi:NADH:ubiquinone oxidoreductase subunit NDUFA12 [Aureimonas psammosilenae]|uniref:NADH:ubiquinone oxidoreductase subunit NDUFA12 n=1 Tax=Aureimonas psammosilenae TaxID=2495496 RepID=UPI001260D75A|nr:NADH:ubiquinone oxidoreductase subunit NDUFA12 [Aureimonas psammosilenae]
MNKLLLTIFTWWNGSTVGTNFYTRRFGKKVGEDERGNVYYQTADGKRRWVIYNGPAEASAIPAGWHGWMHHRTDVAPSQQDYKAKAWEKPHIENLTGTPKAYRPKGSLLKQTKRPRVTGDYDAWQP